MTFVRCDHCHDILYMTQHAKRCHCGAVVGAMTGAHTFSYSGKGTSFSIPPNALDGKVGDKILGLITGQHGIKLGQKTQ